MIDDMAARKLGRHSQRSHIESCKRFTVWLKRSPDTATADEVRAFQLHLIESGCCIGNRNRIMSGVKSLLRVTLRRHDLVAEIYHLREPQRVPLILSQDETRRLLLMAPNLKTRVLLSLAYGTGLRVGEVVRLKIRHIDSVQSIIRVEQGKGRKDRHVMLSPEALTLLRDWWAERSIRWDAGVSAGDRWLFPGRRNGLHLSTHQVSRLFHEATEVAGIRKAVTLHTLRHSFATHLFDRGVDIRTIQALLGHDKLETTARYTRVATGMISSVESPLDNLGGKLKRKRRKS